MSSITASISRIVALSVFGILAGCVSPEPVSEVPAQTVTLRPPPERSYLDPGPTPSSGGTNYLRAGMTAAPRQTDGFGNDVLRRVP